jgi:NAD(P)-dependent dehydrogenase (short-subunit alcohol dehydrogenase family)
MKTILVTGACDGIGFETARALLGLGHTVLVHGRHAKRAQAAVAQLATAGGSALPVWGDFARLAEVPSLVTQVATLTTHLDVLINNAGLYAQQRSMTVDGFELTMGVNHFAPFLLTHHLLPLLAKATAARIVNVSSMTHDGAAFDLDDLDLVHGWSGYGAYATSKLANVLFTRALAARLVGTTANALHPGVIGTKLLKKAFRMQGAPVADGARTSVYLATAPAVEAISGAYFDNCRESRVDARARDGRLIEALWVASQRRLAGFL